MKKSKILVTMFGLGVSAAALSVLTSGCCMFSECKPAPAPTAAVKEQPKQEVKTPAPAKECKKAVVKTEPACPKKAVCPKAEECPKPAVPVKKAEPAKPVVKLPVVTALEAAVWTLKLDSLKGTDKSWEEPMKNITLVYSPKTNQISGCSGVNRYFGPVTVDAAKGIIKPGNLGVTRMAGHGMQYEDLYLKTLNKVDSYSLKDGILTLKIGNDPVAVFVSGVQETK